MSYSSFQIIFKNNPASLLGSTLGGASNAN